MEMESLGVVNHDLKQELSEENVVLRQQPNLNNCQLVGLKLK